MTLPQLVTVAQLSRCIPLNDLFAQLTVDILQNIV